MNMLMIELLTIALLTALVCVIPGVFLVLRGVSLMSDAISHALLLGIVSMFLVVRSLTSPLLLVGATLAGFAVVVLTEYAMQQFKLHKDAAIGLFFPFFFSCAVILISVYTRDVHLDIDMVLLGDMVFAPFSRHSICGVDCGPHAILLITAMLALSMLVVGLLYRPLVMSIFDPLIAHSVTISSNHLYYLMMFLTSMIAVAIFSVVGSVVVVAFMIVPAATAYCTARSVKQMLVHTSFYSINAAAFGYFYATVADVSIAGSIAAATGIIFMLVVMGAPQTGMLGKLWHYGETWLKTCVMLVVKHQKGKTIEVSSLKELYGWKRWWACCVVYYGLHMTKLIKLNNKYYVRE